MEQFTTEGLPGRERAGACARFYGAHLHSAEITARDPNSFAAEMMVGDLGPLRIARLTSSAATLVAGSTTSEQASDRFHILLFQLQGECRLNHYGGTVDLVPGDLSLCDNSVQWRLRLGTSAEVLLVRVPTAMLKEHLPSPESYCGRLLAGRESLASTAATMVLGLLGQLQAGLALHHQARVARHLLDLVATAYAIAFETLAKASSIVSGRHATVKLYIEQHLRDPDLSPCSVAAQLRLSSRYLRMIFATSNETVSAYMLRRRLEECARQIGDASWRGHSMTEIAFSWGFNSAPHFTRSFRDRYAMSPREYRRLKLNEQDNAFRPCAGELLVAGFAEAA